MLDRGDPLAFEILGRGPDMLPRGEEVVEDPDRGLASAKSLYPFTPGDRL